VGRWPGWGKAQTNQNDGLRRAGPAEDRVSSAPFSPQPAAAESRIVEASAGTGKTRALVERVVEVIAAGTPVERIAAVTFTHAAAGEMKWRVRQGLEKARIADPAGPHFDCALQHLDQAFIGTIHSFCAQLLRQRPVEACVDPNFQELDQPQAYELFAGVFREWFEQRLGSPSPAIARALVRMAWLNEKERDPLDALRREAWKLVEWRDHPARWERRPLDRPAELDRLIASVGAVASMRDRCARPGADSLHASLQPLADFLDRVARREAGGGRDYDLIECDLIRLPRLLRYPRKGYGRYSDTVTREALLTAWESLRIGIEGAREKLDADLAAALRDELWIPVERYQAAKRRNGQLDFMDLLVQAGELVRHDGARAYFQQRYDRILIDEFQDTDPLQAEVLMLLVAADPAEREWRRAVPSEGKLFVVGDPKQSVYRFRRADVDLYRGIAQRLGGHGVVRGTLRKSIRSVRPLQDFVNAAFADRMEDYLPLEGGRDPIPGQPAVVALPMPYPFGPRNISGAAINRCSPNAVAAFVDWLVRESGWRVSDPRHPEALVKLEAEHVCILFRRFTNMGVDLTQEYVRSLEARGIGHVLVGSKSFHRREEIGTIRTALRAIEWPDDELSVFATVRGPLFAVADGTLLKFRESHGRLHPFRALPDGLDEEFAHVKDALELLAALHRARNYRPLADTVNRLLEHTRAHAGFAFRKGGGRVLANVYRLTDMARGFEARGATSFRSFLDFLDREAEQGESAEAPLLEQQAGGVKLMTVHKAKGLEFPVVILADLTAKLASGGDGGDRFVDSERGLCAQKLLYCAPWELLDNREREAEADRAEADRIAYVAATRARDLLVVAAVGEQERDESWLAPLYPALYPHRDRYRRAAKHPGCPTRGDRTVLERPLDSPPEETSVHPGLHAPRIGTHEVVWFDPLLLDLKEHKDEGLAYEETLQGTADQLAAGVARYEGWKAKRAAAVEAGAVPEYRVVRATESAAEPGEAAEVEVVRAPRPAGCEGSGRAFGKLVHALLQDAEMPSAMAAMAYARGMGAEADVPAAVEIAKSARRHPLLERAARSACYREMPLILRSGDGSLVEGRVDLAFREGDGWVLVEFKTDSADQLRYRRQLRIYASALREATGLPVRAVLFEV
jgi:ATP-dependent helicase/nuclease subunit A